MPVLDGSIVQLQFGRRGPPSSGVLLPHRAHILLCCFFTNAHPPGHGLHRHTGGVKPQRTRFLGTKIWPVRDIVSSEDAGQPRRDPILSSGHRPNGRPDLRSLPVLEHAAERASAYRLPHGDGLSEADSTRTAGPAARIASMFRSAVVVSPSSRSSSPRARPAARAPVSLPGLASHGGRPCRKPSSPARSRTGEGMPPPRRRPRAGPCPRPPIRPRSGPGSRCC
jgi:hypothetical protein